MQTISREVRLFVPVVVGAATLAVTLLAAQIPWQHWHQMLLFFVVIVVANSFRIQDPRGWWVTPSTVLSYLAIYLFDPATALLVVGTARTVSYALSRAWVPWRALFNGSQTALSVAMGAFVYNLLGGTPQQIGDQYNYVAIAAGPFVHHVANNFFVAYGVSRWRRTPFLNTWISGIRDLSWPNLLSIPTAVLLALLYVKVHYVAIVGYLLLLPFQQRALSRFIGRQQLYAQIVDGLVTATDVNFPLSRGHSRRVADIALAIARELKLAEATVEYIRFAALLHDVGMIGKDDLLDRPVLTHKDVEELQEHVRVGAEIARELPRREIGNLILRHHERYDGTGYPGALRGEAIPLGARVIALAEVVDSMASGTFPFATRIKRDAILAHVVAERGRGFDPQVVDAFVAASDRGAIVPSNGMARDLHADAATSGR